MFVSLPYAGYSDDRHDASVVEVATDGTTTPFPDAAWNAKSGPATSRFLNVQSLTIDANGHLWLLDTGSPRRQGVVPSGAKLVQVDIEMGVVVSVLLFDKEVVSGNDYLNDVRIDPSDGGFAYVTDSASGGLIVMNLSSGAHRRIQLGTPHIAAGAIIVPVVESVLVTDAGGRPGFPATDGLALSRDGETLYLMYRPLAGSRSLLAIPTALLRDFNVDDRRITETTSLAAVAVIADGIETGPDGLIYFTDIERNAVSRLEADGTITLVASSPSLSWPDAIGFGPDGALYVSAPQFHRLSSYNDGVDVSRPPFKIFRIQTAE